MYPLVSIWIGISAIVLVPFILKRMHGENSSWGSSTIKFVIALIFVRKVMVFGGSAVPEVARSGWIEITASFLLFTLLLLLIQRAKFKRAVVSAVLITLVTVLPVYLLSVWVVDNAARSVDKECREKLESSGRLFRFYREDYGRLPSAVDLEDEGFNSRLMALRHTQYENIDPAHGAKYVYLPPVGNPRPKTPVAYCKHEAIGLLPVRTIVLHMDGTVKVIKSDVDVRELEGD